MDPSGRETSSPDAEFVRPRPYKWLGKLVILGYEGGPYWRNLDDPYEIARGTTEAREGVFALEEVSPLGIVVRKAIEGEEALADPVFMSWAAVQSISLVSFEDEPEEEKEEE